MARTKLTFSLLEPGRGSALPLAASRDQIKHRWKRERHSLPLPFPFLDAFAGQGWQLPPALLPAPAVQRAPERRSNPPSSGFQERSAALRLPLPFYLLPLHARSLPPVARPAAEQTRKSSLPLLGSRHPPHHPAVG